MPPELLWVVIPPRDILLLWPDNEWLGALLIDEELLELERGVKVLLGLDGSVRWLRLCPLNSLRLVPVIRCGRAVVRVLLSRFTLPSLRVLPTVLLRGVWLLVCASGVPIVRLLCPMRRG